MRPLAALSLCLLFWVSCAEETGSEAPTAPLRDLCKGATEGATFEEQEAAFFDRAHDAVHRLAEEATDADPGIAAELLETKQIVESRFVEFGEEAVDPELFDRLIAASNAALAAVEEEPISC